MPFAYTQDAALILGISTSALKVAVSRKSSKYEFIRLNEGKKRLLFKLDEKDICKAFNQGLISDKTILYDEKLELVDIKTLSLDNHKLIQENTVTFTA